MYFISVYDVSKILVYAYFLLFNLKIIQFEAFKDNFRKIFFLLLNVLIGDKAINKIRDVRSVFIRLIIWKDSLLLIILLFYVKVSSFIQPELKLLYI